MARRRKSGWDDSMISESAKVEDANRRFNAELEQWHKGGLNESEVLTVGSPLGIMKMFMPKLPVILRQKVLAKARKKHALTADDLKNLPGALATPIFVFKKTPDTLSVLTELKSRQGQNIFVAIELDKDLRLGGNSFEVNDILTLHGREVENVVLPIRDNNSLVWVDKQKGLEWLHSVKSNSQANTIQDLESVKIDQQRTNLAEEGNLDFEDAAKVVRNFENPKFEEEEEVRFRDGADYVERVPVMARALYEKRLQTSMYQITEAMQDSMLGLKEFYKAVESSWGNREIEEVSSYENAYIAENLLSSKNPAICL